MNALSEPRFPLSAAREAVGSNVVEWEAVATRGYARSSAHWRARLADGRRVFIKQALIGTAVECLRAERVIYEAVSRPFMPLFYGAYDDGELALIVLEDLTDEEWPPPWSPRGIESVLVSLAELHRISPPKELEKLEAIRGEIVGWSDIAANQNRCSRQGSALLRGLRKRSRYSCKQARTLNLTGRNCCTST